MAEQEVRRTAVGSPGQLGDLRDGFAEWIHERALPLGAGVAALLLGAAGYAVFSHQREQSAEAAALAVAEVRRAFVGAMGAEPGSLAVPELANPEAAKQIQLEHAQRFRAVAEAHAGTAAAALAWLESGELLAQSGDAAGSLQAWQSGAAAGSGTPLGSALQMKVAHALESAGQLAEAAQAFETAAADPAFPLRAFALAEAARCMDQSGDPKRALELLEAAEAEPAAGAIPETLRSRLRELRVQRAASRAPAAAAAAPDVQP